jgi:hypothetical protein
VIGGLAVIVPLTVWLTSLSGGGKLQTDVVAWQMRAIARSVEQYRTAEHHLPPEFATTSASIAAAGMLPYLPREIVDPSDRPYLVHPLTESTYEVIAPGAYPAAVLQRYTGRVGGTHFRYTPTDGFSSF